MRSGIADYSADLLPHLAERADVRVLRLPDQPVSDEVEARWHPEPAERLLQMAAAGRLPLYQMGNNRYHEAVLELALARPGVVTLHDLVIHHQLLDMTLGRTDDLAPYEERLRLDHGWVGVAVARAKLWGAYGEMAAFALPAHRTLLRRQRGVLVHSRWAAGQIAEEVPDARVRQVPMGVPLPPPADPAAGRAFRERRGIPADAPLLGCFGFQTPIKRTRVAIRALAAPALTRAHLVVVGEVSPALGLAEEARALGVAERVHVTGFVGFDEMEAGIAASDLCLNLRYPSAGETSASLLRILAVGRPAVVSEYAQFAELPADVVVRVPLTREPADEARGLAASVAALLAEPGRLAAMGERARRHVAAEHDPARAAAAIVQACAEWMDAPPPVAAGAPDEEPSLPPPTSLAWSVLAGAIEVAGARAPWPAGERRRLTVRLVNRGPAVWLAGAGGPGGVALAVGWRGDGRGWDGRPRDEHPWRALPRDLPPGETLELTVETRRPPGSSALVIEPHVLGGVSFAATGGPVFYNPLP